METDTVTGWFAVSSGKVYARCPACQSPRISYYKERRPGLKGISAASHGLTPVCTDCGKNLPTQNSKEKKLVSSKVISSRAF